MEDGRKTREELLEETETLRRRLTKLQSAELERKQAEDLLRIQSDLAVALGSTSDLKETFDRLLEISFQINGIDCAH